MFRSILLKIILSALIVSPISVISVVIIKNTKERDRVVFNSTRRIIEKNLSLSSIQHQKVEGLGYFDAYSYELRQLISEAESGSLFDIVITNLKNEIQITNADRKSELNDARAKEVISSYQNKDRHSEYDKVTRINIKSGRNIYGVSNNIGYAYFRYHPQKVTEIEQEKAFIISIAAISSVLALGCVYFSLSYFLNQLTLEQIISQGEKSDIEFKPSFFTDTNIKGGRQLEYECAKVIASFLNTQGGYLLIGVSDDGEITGLDKDFEYITNNRGNKQTPSDPNKCDRDEYMRKLKGRLSNLLNKKAVSLLKLNIKQAEDGELLIIRCPPASVPVLNKTNSSKWNICFRSDSESVVYRDISYGLQNNQVVPLWKLIATNFSSHKNISRLLFWKIKNLLVQI